MDALGMFSQAVTGFTGGMMAQAEKSKAEDIAAEERMQKRKAQELTLGMEQQRLGMAERQLAWQGEQHAQEMKMREKELGFKERELALNEETHRQKIQLGEYELQKQKVEAENFAEAYKIHQGLSKEQLSEAQFKNKWLRMTDGQKMAYSAGYGEDPKTAAGLDELLLTLKVQEGFNDVKKSALVGTLHKAKTSLDSVATADGKTGGQKIQDLTKSLGDVSTEINTVMATVTDPVARDAKVKALSRLHDQLVAASTSLLADSEAGAMSKDAAKAHVADIDSVVSEASEYLNLIRNGQKMAKELGVGEGVAPAEGIGPRLPGPWKDEYVGAAGESSSSKITTPSKSPEPVVRPAATLALVPDAAASEKAMGDLRRTITAAHESAKSKAELIDAIKPAVLKYVDSLGLRTEEERRKKYNSIIEGEVTGYQIADAPARLLRGVSRVGSEMGGALRSLQNPR